MAILFIIIVLLGLGGLYFWYITTSVPEKMRHEATQRELAAKYAKKQNDDLLAELELNAKRAELLNQSQIVGDINTYNAVMDETYDGPLPEKRNDGAYLSMYDNLRILKIAGINHRPGIIRYRGRIESVLVPEPDNEYDPLAIKVLADDRHHLGYVPSHQTEFVRSLACDQFPYRCVSFITEHTDEIDGHTFYDGQIYIKKRE